MKKIKVDLASRQSFFLHDWEFVQTAFKEALAESVGYLPSTCILRGCVVTHDGLSGATISGGAVMREGEIYMVPTTTFAPGTLSGTVLVLLEEQDFAISPSPVIMDGVSRSPHIHRILQPIAGTVALNPDALVAEDIDRAEGSVLNGAIDDWHVVGDVGEPAYVNSFVGGSGSLQPLRFRRVSNNIVELDGTIVIPGNGSTTPSITKAFDLPDSSYFPSKNRAFIGATTIWEQNSYLQVDSNGEVKCRRLFATTTLHLNAARYYIN